MKTIEIDIYSIIGNNFCVSMDDGKKVIDKIIKTLDDGNRVEISFKNIDLMTSAFLNAAIGDLFENFTEDKINELIKFKDIQEDDSTLLNRVIETAKFYYKDKERFNNIVSKSLETY
jgi:hypothetical protein